MRRYWLMLVAANDCVEHSAVREFFIDARKAIAAIDALGEAI